MPQKILTEASITIADDGDVLITILKGSGINLQDEVSVSVHDNSLIIEQNSKKYADVEIKDKTFLDAVQNAPNIVMAECDDDGFEVFPKVMLAS